MSDVTTDLGLWALPVAVLGGAIRVGTPYLYVSLGECLTEKSGRVNLGLEGTLIMGAMSGYGVSYWASKYCFPPATAAGEFSWVFLCPWLGVLAAAFIGLLLGALHAVICNRPNVNSVAVGIAMMIFGQGLAYYLGKPLIQPSAPQLPSVPFGDWLEQLSHQPLPEPVKAALRINALFIVGLALVPLMAWMLIRTRWGMIVRVAGESEEAAAALGYSVKTIRIVATAIGGALAGIGGSFLSLYYPGSWSEQISSGQGLLAVALVIFARWSPVNCLWASLLFGGVGSLGLALQTLKLTSASAAYLWNAAPYVFTMFLVILTSSRARAMVGAPLELTRVR